MVKEKHYQKTTEELFHEIEEEKSMQSFFQENKNEMKELSHSAYLQYLLEVHRLKKAELFRRAGLVGNNYGYELFRSDRKTPSRDILLRLSLAFPLNMEETQQLLRQAGLATLYPRDRRDAYVLFALNEKKSVDELNSLLLENGLKTLD